MKKIFLFIMLTCSCSLLAAWHSWDTPPKKDQVYMFVDMEPCAKIEDRQILVITHFDDLKPVCRHRANGWWDVQSLDILRWCSEGSKVLYCPTGIDKDFVRRIESMVAYKEIKE